MCVWSGPSLCALCVYWHVMRGEGCVCINGPSLCALYVCWHVMRGEGCVCVEWTFPVCTVCVLACDER